MMISFAPNRNDPPILSTSFCSGNKSITGFGVLGSISAELALSRPHTFLPNSTAAN